MSNKNMIKTTFTNGKLKIVCEPQVREVDGKWFADAYLYKGKHSANFFTALNTGDLECGELQLSKAECDWLHYIEDHVCETIDTLDMENNGILLKDYRTNMKKYAYDIEFAVQTEIYMRVQADSAEEARRIATDRFHKTNEFTIKSGNMDRQIIGVRVKEEPCNLEATNQDMVYEYKYDMGKDK